MAPAPPALAAAARHGIDAPLTTRLVAMIAAVERGEAVIGQGLIARVAQA